MIKPILYDDEKKPVPDYEYLEKGIIRSYVENKLKKNKNFKQHVMIAQRKNYHSLDGISYIPTSDFNNNKLIDKIEQLEMKENLNFAPFIKKNIKEKIFFEIIDDLINGFHNMKPIKLISFNLAKTKKTKTINNKTTKPNVNNYDSDTENVIKQIHTVNTSNTDELDIQITIRKNSTKQNSTKQNLTKHA